MDKRGRTPRQPAVQAGRVGKRGRGRATRSAITASVEEIIRDATTSNTSVANFLETSASYSSATPSTSRALQPSSSTVQSCSTEGSTSVSMADSENSEKLQAARAHLTSISGVVSVPPIYQRPLNSRNLIRIKGDLMHLYKDPPPGIQVMQDENDMTLIHAVITGPTDTPYEGGFFYFLITCHSDYPIDPPKVKFMTTGGGKVRMNPNLYASGRVCLSVLGTWPGPRWTPLQTLSSLLIQIQSNIFTEKPYYNEPGLYTSPSSLAASGKYNEVIQHETIRVAVVGAVNNDFNLSIPDALRNEIIRSFLAMFDIYEAKVISKLHLTGTRMISPWNSGKFMYDKLLKRLRALNEKLRNETPWDE